MPSAALRVRFSATDNPNNSVTEAGIDAFSIYEYQCATCAKGDVNGSGDVDADDVQPFVAELITGGTPGSAGYCATDMNGNGVLEAGADVALFVACLTGGGCP